MPSPVGVHSILLCEWFGEGSAPHVSCKDAPTAEFFPEAPCGSGYARNVSELPEAAGKECPDCTSPETEQRVEANLNRGGGEGMAEALMGHSLAMMLAVRFPGGLRAFRQQGGATAVVGRTVVVLHPDLPGSICEEIRGWAHRQRHEARFLRRACFDGDMAQREVFTQQLASYAAANDLEDMTCALNPCVVCVTLRRPYIIAVESIRKFLDPWRRACTYCIIAAEREIWGECTAAPCRGVLKAQPERQPIDEQRVLDLKILLGLYGKDVDEFLRRM